MIFKIVGATSASFRSSLPLKGFCKIGSLETKIKGTGLINDPAYVAPAPIEGQEPAPVPQIEVEKYALRYNELIAPLIKAVQELSAKVDSQQLEINQLKLRVNELESPA